MAASGVLPEAIVRQLMSEGEPIQDAEVVENDVELRQINSGSDE